jgi:hypothetical protein
MFHNVMSPGDEMSENHNHNTSMEGNVNKLIQIKTVEGDVIIQPAAVWPVSLHKIQGPHASRAQNFAELCRLLILQEYSNSTLEVTRDEIEQPGTNLILKHQDGQIHVFQSHYIASKLQEADKRRVTELLAAVLMQYAPAKWTLCIPINFLPNERNWFRKELKAQAITLAEKGMANNHAAFPKLKTPNSSTIEVESWCESTLLALLLKYQDISRIFFGARPPDTLSSPANLIIDWKGAKWDYHNNSVFVSFAIANTGGGIAKVEEIRIEVLGTYPTSESESSWIGAVMKEFQFAVELNPSQTKYTIGENLNFVYKHGDIDGFKVKMTSLPRLFYKLVIRVVWYDIENKVMRITETDPFLAHFPYI